MENKILVLDIETTNFLKKGGSIVEIGIVELCLDSGEINIIFDSLLREPILTAKHRDRSKKFGWIFDNSDLTVEAVREAPSSGYVFAQVQSILNDYPLGCTAYNKKFDFDFLKDRGIVIPNELQCPMLLSTPIVGACFKNGRVGKFPNVEEAFAYFLPDVKYTEEHRGADDAKHEAMIVYELCKLGVFKV